MSVILADTMGGQLEADGGLKAKKAERKWAAPYCSAFWGGNSVKRLEKCLRITSPPQAARKE